MNRPDFEDYRWKYRTQWPYDVARYVTHMEEYCDKLERAVDKAYEVLHAECIDSEAPESMKRYDALSKEQWMELLLKDE